MLLRAGAGGPCRRRSSSALLSAVELESSAARELTEGTGRVCRERSRSTASLPAQVGLRRDTRGRVLRMAACEGGRIERAAAGAVGFPPPRGRKRGRSSRSVPFLTLEEERWATPSAPATTHCVCKRVRVQVGGEALDSIGKEASLS